MNELTTQACIPCEGGVEPLTHEQAEKLLLKTPGWKIEKHAIKREYTFKDFKDAMVFVNRVAEIAESEGHHPDIMIWYRVVTLVFTTHAIGGLSINDFIVAAKIDARVPTTH